MLFSDYKYLAKNSEKRKKVVDNKSEFICYQDFLLRLFLKRTEKLTKVINEIKVKNKL